MSFRVTFGREYQMETLQIGDSTEQHIENCRCTVKETYWPCGEIQEVMS
ncbi:hypothetical protein ACIBG0_38900 [Nocardia sp. NPDC050630]